MARNWVRHRVTGQRIEVERDDNGQLFLVVNGRRQRWTPEDGEWVPHDVEVKVTAVQVAKMVYAADTVMKEILCVTTPDKNFLDLAPRDKAAWIEGVVELEGVRGELARHIRSFLEGKVLSGE